MLSDSFQNNDCCCKLDKTEVIVAAGVPARGDTPKSFEPTKQSLHLPATLIPSHGSAILMTSPTSSSFRSDQLDVSFVVERPSELCAVEGLVANESLRQSAYNSFIERLVHQRDIVSRPLGHGYGNW